jgi:hypothetical protein
MNSSEEKNVSHLRFKNRSLENDCYILMPASRSVAPVVSSSSCPWRDPCRASSFRPHPVPLDPDPSAGIGYKMSVNPDMETAWPGRTRHNNNIRRRRRSNIDFNLIEGVRLSTDYYAARHIDNRNKT